MAAASLAQVYKAQLDDGRSVAVKVQRPQILEQVSKDLYVLRRGGRSLPAIDRPLRPNKKQITLILLNEWAVGFYTELDFRSEIDNLNAIRDVLVDAGARVDGVVAERLGAHAREERLGAHAAHHAATTVDGVYVPYALEELCTARE